MNCGCLCSKHRHRTRLRYRLLKSVHGTVSEVVALMRDVCCWEKIGIVSRWVNLRVLPRRDILGRSPLVFRPSIDT